MTSVGMHPFSIGKALALSKKKKKEIKTATAFPGCEPIFFTEEITAE